ncbi:hypothetical protein [Streptomyces sp. NPDC017991]|uniref:hypothetical protein n=1 Tax=Streptomyces sp. NPDC017991 TaxID=3365026 RepID=UPI003793705E
MPAPAGGECRDEKRSPATGVLGAEAGSASGSGGVCSARLSVTSILTVRADAVRDAPGAQAAHGRSARKAGTAWGGGEPHREDGTQDCVEAVADTVTVRIRDPKSATGTAVQVSCEAWTGFAG